MKARFLTCCLSLLLLTISFANAAKVEDFIPQESLLYLKLQDIDEVYGEIETSKSWEKAFALLPNTPDWQEMQQGIAMVQGFLGTDLLSVIQTVGYRTAFAVWSNAENTPEMGLTVHSGGNLSELQRFTKIVEGLIGMSDTNTFHVDAGEYQRVPYNMMKVNQQYVAKYGFVDEFLVLGIGENAFEKLMDTFRKKGPSIAKNTHYAKISKAVGSGQVSLFCNVQHTLKNFRVDGEKEDLNDLEKLITALDQLDIFEVLLGEFNLLETGEFFTLHGPFTQHAIERFYQLAPNSGRLLKGENRFKTVKAVSTDEDLFIAIAPVVSEVLWQGISKFIAEEADDDVYAGISFFEGLLNLNLEDDIFPSLTGEIAIAINDLAQFDPSALESLEIEFDGAFSMDAGGAETQGALIFNASNPRKWSQLGNSISNLQNLSVSQTDHNGVSVSTFATNLHYATVDGLFLFGSSEEQMYALIDEIKNGKSPVYFMQLPKPPIAIAQLNVERAFELEKGPPPSDRVFVNSSEIPPMVAWVSVKDNEASLEMSLSRKTTGLEALARLMPFVIWNMEGQ
ncbi:MAG: DUF3352 domain-containing protein [Candidatus Poribacteria bacterium]|nr:DUF3352 domain-containing protein [Candidatus Poribacteria bacterium]